MSQKIQVVFSTDNNYAKQLLIALTSLVHNTTSPIVVSILDGGLSESRAAWLRTGAEALGAEVRFIPIDKKFLGHFPTSDYYRQVAYARLQLPDLMKDVDRVIYLDPDLIVRHDIVELWNLDVTNVSAAVNRDIDVDFLVPFKKALGLGPDNLYFNSGVMLLNLARMRETGFVNRAIAFANEHPEKISVVDQDVFNYVLMGDVVYFPLRWNFSPLYYTSRDDREFQWRNLFTYYSVEEQREAEQDPAIVHYANTIKPWHCSPVARLHPWYDEFFRYVDLYQEGLGKVLEPLEPPRISVVMPCRNVEPFLYQAVDSVLTQTVSAIEVIAIDDGSTDQTGRMLDDFARWDRRMTVLHQENRGLGATYNRGLDCAKGEYIAFVEPDDWVDVGGFACLMSHADRLQCDIVKADFSLVEGTSITRVDKYANERLPEVCHFYEIESAPHGHCGFWAGLYRRDFLNRHHIRFPELPGAGYVDVAFLWTSHILAESISVIQRVVYYYRQHASASIGAAAISKNWPLLIRNYELVMDFVVAKGVAPLYADNLLLTLYNAVCHALMVIDPDGRREMIKAVRPLFITISNFDRARVVIPEDARRGIRALQRGRSPVRDGLKLKLKRRLRWIVKDPRIAGDVSRIRRSPIVQALNGSIRWSVWCGRECLSLVVASARLCRNAARSLAQFFLGRSRPLGALSANRSGGAK